MHKISQTFKKSNKAQKNHFWVGFLMQEIGYLKKLNEKRHLKFCIYTEQF